MTDQILMRNVMKINENRLEPFCEAVREAVAFAERHGPQLMVRTFIDDNAMRATSFQLYRNSQDIVRHWELADPHIQNVSQYCSVERLEVYGAPSDAVLAGLGPFLADERGVIIAPLTGFSRF